MTDDDRSDNHWAEFSVRVSTRPEVWNNGGKAARQPG